MVPKNNLARTLKTLYFYSDSKWLYFRLDVGGLYPGVFATSVHKDAVSGATKAYFNYGDQYSNITNYVFCMSVPTAPAPLGASGGRVVLPFYTGVYIGNVEPSNWFFMFGGPGAYPFSYYTNSSASYPNYNDFAWNALNTQGSGYQCAVNYTAGSIMMAFNRTIIEQQLGPLGKVNMFVCSYKPGEAYETFGERMNPFVYKSPGDEGGLYYDGWSYAFTDTSDPYYTKAQWDNASNPMAGSNLADWFTQMGVIYAPGKTTSRSTLAVTAAVPLFTVDMSPGAGVRLVDAKTGNNNIVNKYVKNQAFTLNVTVTTAINIANWTVGLSWNSSVLNCTGFTYINQFFNATTRASGTISNTAGNFTKPYSASTTTPVNGTGTLAQATFKVINYGNTWISLTAKLLNSTGAPIPYPVTDAFFELMSFYGPTAEFTYSPLTPNAKWIITFNASASSPGFNGSAWIPIANYTWNFGDANKTTTSSPVIKHSYASVGSYPVNLTVTCKKDPVLTAHSATSASMSLTVMAGYYDAAVISVTPSPTKVTVGRIVNVTVVAMNNGSFAETFPVTAYYNTTAISTQTVTSLAAGATKTLTFTWNTTGVALGSYTIKANATLTGDMESDNNQKIDGQVEVASNVDVGIISVTPSPTSVTVGSNVTITVVVKNNGTATGTFPVTAYYNTTAIGTQTVTNLLAGHNTTLTFTWDTAGVAAGNYTIKANATLTGDISPGDNALTDGQVKVSAKSVTPTWLLIAIIAVVVVVIIVIVVYVFMLRRKKPTPPAT
jgi:hypothetical protein